MPLVFCHWIQSFVKMSWDKKETSVCSTMGKQPASLCFPLGMYLFPLFNLLVSVHEHKARKRNDSWVNSSMKVFWELFLSCRNCDSQIDKGISKDAWRQWWALSSLVNPFRSHHVFLRWSWQHSSFTSSVSLIAKKT